MGLAGEREREGEWGDTAVARGSAGRRAWLVRQSGSRHPRERSGGCLPLFRYVFRCALPVIPPPPRGGHVSRQCRAECRTRRILPLSTGCFYRRSPSCLRRVEGVGGAQEEDSRGGSFAASSLEGQGQGGGYASGRVSTV
ncbi:hypothetical protein KM043_006656 [Ampulex compressa]|nr:hypothetical protein KM043_006656 [Ampulex compressa]